MKRALLASLAALVAAAPAAAQTPPQRLTIVSLFDPIAYGQKAFVNGQLIGDGDGDAGQVVTLQEAPFPFTTWADAAQETTDYQGFYSFMRRPVVTTHYRTVWNGMTSEQEAQVRVIPRLSFSASQAAGSLVRFKGALAPAHADDSVVIQRQTRSGGWRTATKARLRGGRTFSGRLRVHQTIRVRAAFVSTGDVLPGYSRPVTVSVG